MAYWLMKKNTDGISSQSVFYLDSNYDLPDLPTTTSIGVDQGDGVSHLVCGRGSIAVSITNSEVYILKANDEWELFDLLYAVIDSGSGGSGGSESFDPEDILYYINNVSNASAQRDAIVCSNNVASKNITKGKFVVNDGVLYVATANISNGSTLSSSNLREITDGGYNEILSMIGDVESLLASI